MPRLIPDSLGTRLDAQITAVGYLLRAYSPGVLSAAASQTIFLSDIGDIVNSLGTWTGEDMKVSGAGSENVTVSIQNLNNAMAAYVLNATALADVMFDLWQFERGDAEHAVYLGEFRAANARIGLDRVEIALRQFNLQYRYAPTKRIDARNGFHYAMHPGDVITWGNQRIVMSERR